MEKGIKESELGVEREGRREPLYFLYRGTREVHERVTFDKLLYVQCKQLSTDLYAYGRLFRNPPFSPALPQRAGKNVIRGSDFSFAERCVFFKSRARLKDTGIAHGEYRDRNYVAFDHRRYSLQI